MTTAIGCSISLPGIWPAITRGTRANPVVVADGRANDRDDASIDLNTLQVIVDDVNTTQDDPPTVYRDAPVVSLPDALGGRNGSIRAGNIEGIIAQVAAYVAKLRAADDHLAIVSVHSIVVAAGHAYFVLHVAVLDPQVAAALHSDVAVDAASNPALAAFDGEVGSPPDGEGDVETVVVFTSRLDTADLEE